MSNQIKDTDVLAFVDAAREELGLSTLMVWSGLVTRAYLVGSVNYGVNIEANSIAELKQKLAEDTPEARLAKEIADTEATLARLKEKQGGGNE